MQQRHDQTSQGESQPCSQVSFKGVCRCINTLPHNCSTLSSTSSEHPWSTTLATSVDSGVTIYLLVVLLKTWNYSLSFPGFLLNLLKEKKVVINYKFVCFLLPETQEAFTCNLVLAGKSKCNCFYRGSSITSTYIVWKWRLLRNIKLRHCLPDNVVQKINAQVTVWVHIIQCLVVFKLHGDTSRSLPPHIMTIWLNPCPSNTYLSHWYLVHKYH